MYEVTLALDVPFPISGEAGRTQRELRKSIEDHNAKMAEVTEQIATLQGTSAAAWSDSDDTAATRLRNKKRQLLVEAIKIRNLGASFYLVLMMEEKLAAVNTALAENGTVLERVQSDLIRIGYASDDPQLEKMARRHPLACAAYSALLDRQSYDNGDNRQENEKQLAKLQGELERYRDRAVAGL
ncbi:MAG: hypothetical protein AB7O68_08215 [Pirellulales bacterium]